MAKTKALVETICNYFVEVTEDGITYGVGLKAAPQRFPVEFNVKDKANAGGEIWDWATRHWDEFIPEDGRPVTMKNGAELIPKLRWACIIGVYNMKGELLPVKQEPRAYKTKTTKPKNTYSRKSKAVGKSTYKEASKKAKKKAEVYDFESFKQNKIEKAMTAEDNDE